MTNSDGVLNSVRIPTLLGLAILFMGLGGAVFLVNQNQIFQSHAAPLISPTNISITNITDSQASISWETDQNLPGFIKFGTSTAIVHTAGDIRDINGPQNHKIHFVNLTNLSPNTTYYFKISSGTSYYPLVDTLRFSTSSVFNPTGNLPIIGDIIDSSGQPPSEALITLEIPGAQTISTISKLSGSFILPLADLRSTDLSQSFSWPKEGVEGKLTITDLKQTSIISIHLPSSKSSLPLITLGQNYNINVPLQSPTPSISPTSSPLSKYDLNGDGKVNILDALIVARSFGKKDKRLDFDGDGIVDQKDLNIIDGVIANSTSP